MSDCKLKLSYCHSVCWERFQACWYYHEGFTGPAWVVAKCRWWFFLWLKGLELYSSQISEVYCCASFWSDCAVFKQFSLSGNQCLSAQRVSNFVSIMVKNLVFGLAEIWLLYDSMYLLPNYRAANIDFSWIFIQVRLSVQTFQQELQFVLHLPMICFSLITQGGSEKYCHSGIGKWGQAGQEPRYWTLNTQPYYWYMKLLN